MTPGENNTQQNYVQVWRDKYSSASFVMFVDNKHRLDVPCSATMDDKEFLEHVHDFYNLIRAEGGIMEILSAMVLARIEVIKVALKDQSVQGN